MDDHVIQDGKRDEPQIRAWLLPIALALIAASAPIATVVHGRAQLKLADVEQRFKIQSEYLRLATDPTRSAAARQSVLRFLVKTIDDEPMKAWAEAELRAVDDEVAVLKKRIAELEGSLHDTEQKLETAIRQRDQATVKILQREREDLKSRRQDAVVNLTGVAAAAKVNSLPADGRGRAGGELGAELGSELGGN